MGLSAKDRRQLMARANRLPAVATIAAEQMPESAVEHVRAYLALHELAKVRINATDRDECRRAAEDLAARVPCEIVGRVGRVVVLCIPPDPDSGSPVPRT
jgi:RNA-binding protein